MSTPKVIRFTMYPNKKADLLHLNFFMSDGSIQRHALKEGAAEVDDRGEVLSFKLTDETRC